MSPAVADQSNDKHKDPGGLRADCGVEESWCAKRKRQTKGAPSPRLALGPQPTLVRLDNPSADEETKPDSGLRMVVANKGLKERR
jgi:hypothetical protein